MESSPEYSFPPEDEATPPPQRWYPFRDKPFPTYGEAVLMTIGMTAVQVLIGIALGIVIVAIHMMRDGRFGGLSANELVILGVVSQAAMVPVIGWGVWRLRKRVPEALCLRSAPALALLGVVLLSAGLHVCVSELDNLVRAKWPLLNLLEDFLGATPEAPIGMFIVVCVMAPLFEEALFRSLILDGLARRSGPRRAILVSAILFGIAHLNPAQVPFAFLMGIFFGWVFLRTRSYWAAVLSHFVMNCMAIVLPLFLTVEISGYNSGPEAGVFQPLWLDLAGLALLVVGMLIFAAVTPSRSKAYEVAGKGMDAVEEAV